MVVWTVCVVLDFAASGIVRVESVLGCADPQNAVEVLDKARYARVRAPFDETVGGVVGNNTNADLPTYVEDQAQALMDSSFKLYP